jgi:hypothetical protein
MCEHMKHDRYTFGSTTDHAHFLTVEQGMDIFFLKRRQKICLDLLIKKKRIAQLINEKPDENHQKKTTCLLLSKHETL